MVKEYLSQKGVAFTERDVATDRTAAGEIMRLTGQMAVPVTIIDGQIVVGFDRPKLDYILSTIVKGPSLGAAVGDASRITAMRGLPPSNGAFVGAVKPGSTAQRMGIVMGDIIIEINGQPVHDAGEMESLMGRMGQGDRLVLVFQRGGNRHAAEGVL
jgi:S1-C subfamily serine protease